MRTPFGVPAHALSLARRRALTTTGLTLSAAAVALLGGRDALAAAKGRSSDHAADVRILNTALGAEYEAVAAYQVGADSGLLKGDALTLAQQFQGHHKAHVEALEKTVTTLGGRAVEQRNDYQFPVETLKTQADVLRFAAGLEKGAVSAYLGAVPLFGDRELARVAASILGDEAMHWAVLRNVLGERPVVPVSFVA